MLLFGEVGLGINLLLLFVTGRRIPRFWPKLGRSALAGLICGLLVLGPGLRLAMRVVAVADPNQSPEFTVGGTLGIVVLIGGVLGPIYAIVAVFARDGFAIARGVTAGAVAVALLGLLVANADLRNELLHLGLGGWMNVPMFAAVGFAHGWVSLGCYDWFDRRAKTKPVLVESTA